MAARAARPTSFCLAADLYMGPPGRGGTFWFQIFIQAPSPEIWRKTIFGGEGGCWRGKWGGLFWATSLEEIFGGVIAIISFRPGVSSLPYRGVLSFLTEAREVSGCEEVRLHTLLGGAAVACTGRRKDRMISRFKGESHG